MTKRLNSLRSKQSFYWGLSNIALKHSGKTKAKRGIDHMVGLSG